MTKFSEGLFPNYLKNGLLGNRPSRLRDRVSGMYYERYINTNGLGKARHIYAAEIT